MSNAEDDSAIFGVKANVVSYIFCGVILEGETNYKNFQ